MSHKRFLSSGRFFSGSSRSVFFKLWQLFKCSAPLSHTTNSRSKNVPKKTTRVYLVLFYTGRLCRQAIGFYRIILSGAGFRGTGPLTPPPPSTLCIRHCMSYIHEKDVFIHRVVTECTLHCHAGYVQTNDL